MTTKPNEVDDANDAIVQTTAATSRSEQIARVALELLRLATEIDAFERPHPDVVPVDQEALRTVHRLAKSDVLFDVVIQQVNDHLCERARLVRLARLAELVPAIVAAARACQAEHPDDPGRRDEAFEGKLGCLCERSQVSITAATLGKLKVAALRPKPAVSVSDRIRVALGVGGRTIVQEVESALRGRAPKGGVIKSQDDALGVLHAVALSDRYLVEYLLGRRPAPC
jgi:hypothetical protein